MSRQYVTLEKGRLTHGRPFSYALSALGAGDNFDLRHGHSKDSKTEKE
jgi:hypothetical protein